VDRYPFRARSAVRPRVLWLRAYHPIYAPDVAVRAAAELAGRYEDLRLTMVGDDKGERARTRELVAELGLGGQVRVDGFAGPDEKQRLLADHDVFLNTSRVDNRPSASSRRPPRGCAWSRPTWVGSRTWSSTGRRPCSWRPSTVVARWQELLATLA
jgi:hypothetical protein